MSEVKYYHVSDTGLAEGTSLGRITVVLGADYDAVVSRIGNMICAKRQMDEELEIARDDLVIFKGALSALGEASKKLVVCARTTGGTAGPDEGLMDACAGVEGVITLAGVARAMNEFDRVKAERDALQLLLNERDEQLHTLEQSRRAHFESGQAAEQSNVILLGLLERWYEANCNDLVHVEDGAYRIVLDTNEALEGKSVASRCTWSREDDCGTWHSACGVSWTFHDDGPIENGMNFCHACGDCIAVEEHAEENSADDGIPDFSPGNGNKARRRAETIHGFKIVEDQSLAPGEMKLVQPAEASAFSDANEPPCTACFARGCNGECSGDGAMGD